jgi:hypothetical protein
MKTTTRNETDAADPMAAVRAHHWTRFEGSRWVFDAEKAVEEFARARVVDGVVRWEANGSVPPSKVVSDFLAVGVIDAATAEASEAARKAETAAFLDAYRRNPPAVSDELRAELRAELGPAANVVDVITGRRIRL